MQSGVENDSRRPTVHVMCDHTFQNRACVYAIPEITVLFLVGRERAIPVVPQSRYDALHT